MQIDSNLEKNLRKLKVLTKFKANAAKLEKQRGIHYRIMSLECAFDFENSIEGIAFWMDIWKKLRELKKLENLDKGGQS